VGEYGVIIGITPDEAVDDGESKRSVSRGTVVGAMLQVALRARPERSLKTKWTAHRTERTTLEQARRRGLTTTSTEDHQMQAGDRMECSWAGAWRSRRACWQQRRDVSRQVWISLLLTPADAQWGHMRKRTFGYTAPPLSRI